jgi:integrase
MTDKKLEKFAPKAPIPPELTRRTFTAEELKLAAKAESTRTAYAKDITYYRRMGYPLPSTAADALRWLVAVAPRLKPATIQRRMIALHAWHKDRGLPSPIDKEVKTAFAGLGRTVGLAQRAVKPLMRDDLLAVLVAVQAQEPVRAARDTALLLFLFCGALRRQSLVQLKVEDLTFHELGVDVLLRRSKTDQEGRGLVVSIPFANGRQCPVAAIQRWCELAGIRSGHLFRRVTRSGAVGATRLDISSVARVVKAAVARAGLDPAHYSSHSGRAGFVSTAGVAQMPLAEIAQVTKHRGLQSLQKYLRIVDQRRVRSLL